MRSRPERAAPFRTWLTALWNGAVRSGHYARPGAEQYQVAVLERYKLCVEMANRVSARHSLTNTFFLTLNSAELTAAGALSGPTVRTVPTWGLASIGFVALCQCVAWFLLIRSYRQLNAAKYKVIGELEKRLPALPYSDAERAEFGEGKSSTTYLPLTHVELWGRR